MIKLALSIDTPLHNTHTHTHLYMNLYSARITSLIYATLNLERWKLKVKIMNEERNKGKKIYKRAYI